MCTERVAVRNFRWWVMIRKSVQKALVRVYYSAYVVWSLENCA